MPDWFPRDLIDFLGSIGGIIAGIGAIWIIVAASRKPRPVVRLDLSPVENRPGWHHGYVHVSNRSDIPLQAESLTLHQPKTAGLLNSNSELFVRDVFRQDYIDPLPVEKTVKTLALGFAVAAVGFENPNTFHGGKASHGFGFLVHIPSQRLERVSFTLSLKSRDHRERKTTISIKTVATPHAAKKES